MNHVPPCTEHRRPWLAARRAAAPALVACFGFAAGFGCDKEGSEATAAASAAAAASASAGPSALGSTGAAPRAPERPKYRLRTGPVLGIFRGEGVGPIRFGANVGTIERLMAKPCDEKTKDRCRYFGRAVEFYFDDDGGTREIHVHGLERWSGPDTELFGIFNGRFPGGAQFGMLPRAIEDLLGKPERVEDVKDGGKRRTEKIFHYSDMRLEFDRIDNGNLVLGGVVLLPLSESKPGLGTVGAPSAAP